MLMLVFTAAAALAGEPLAKPATIEVRVAPDEIEPGGEARVTLRVVPIEGVKINRYPKIKLTVPEVDGVVLPAEAALGNPKPPPVDDPESNYFKKPEDLALDVRVSPGAPVGPLQIEGRLKYFYCVAASGYCAPARAEVKIPVTVR
jgi:hypothetical protein